MSCNIFPYFMTFALHLFHMCAATRLCLFSLPSICFLSLFRTALPGILPFCLFRLPLFSFAPVRVIAPPPAFSPPSLFSFLSAAAQVLSFYISRPSTAIKKGAATCVAAPLIFLFVYQCSRLFSLCISLFEHQHCYRCCCQCSQRYIRPYGRRIARLGAGFLDKFRRKLYAAVLRDDEGINAVHCL